MTPEHIHTVQSTWLQSAARQGRGGAALLRKAVGDRSVAPGLVPRRHAPAGRAPHAGDRCDGERARPPGTHRPLHRRAGATLRQLRRQGSSLRHGRCRAALDARPGPGCRVHPESESRMGHHLCCAGFDHARGGCFQADQESVVSGATQSKGRSMTTAHLEREPAGIIGHTAVICLVAALGLAATAELKIMPTVGTVQPAQPPIPAAPSAILGASRFTLDASSRAVAGPPIWAMCGALCLSRRCATKSLWSSSPRPSAFTCTSAGACAMAACLPFH